MLLLDEIPMPRRRLGSTGWEVSMLALGGVNYHLLPDAEAAAVVHRALDLGINMVDTAAAYGKGESERKIGLVMAERRGEVFLNSKTGDRTRDGALASVEQSLKRLRTDHIDLLFVHGVENEEDARRILQRPGVLDALEELRAAGVVRYLGLSGHNDRDAMLACLREYPFDAVLFPVGAANRVRYSFEETILPYAHERGMIVLGMKLMLMGKVRETRDPSVYLRYSLNLPIHAGVVGVDNMAQLEYNVAVAKGSLDPVEGEALQQLLAEARDVTAHFSEGQWCWLPECARG
ncbi:MAG: aldo/keto reductase [Armatimonadota bacterium]|nr:aldo/keto reductase [Armatimonadota bacterium]